MVTNHCIERNDRLWHDGIQEVIEAFPEEEPSGVDVGSHLCKKEGVNVCRAFPVMREHSEHFPDPHSHSHAGDKCSRIGAATVTIATVPMTVQLETSFIYVISV